MSDVEQETRANRLAIRRARKAERVKTEQAESNNGRKATGAGNANGSPAGNL